MRLKKINKNHSKLRKKIIQCCYKYTQKQININVDKLNL